MLHLAGLMLQIWTKTIPTSHPCLNLYSTHSKTGPSSNSCHKSCCYLSEYCPSKTFRKKSGKKILGKCFLPIPTFHWWHVMQINSPRQKCHKFSKTLSVPDICGGCRRCICVYFTCLSLLDSALLSLFTTFGGKLLSLSVLKAMMWQRSIWSISIGRYRYIDI